MLALVILSDILSMSNFKKAIAILAGISLYASAHAVPVFYSGTGNYYEYVSDSVSQH